ncbi:bacteriocin-like protein [Chryseobacterium aahli]
MKNIKKLSRENLKTINGGMKDCTKPTQDPDVICTSHGPNCWQPECRY